MKHYVALIVGTTAALGCVRLGFWQLDRLAERRALSQQRAGRLARPPLAVDTLPVEVALDTSLSFHPAVARGVFDFRRQIVVIGRSMDGVPVVHVTTPLLLADGRSLLVERGAVYSPDSRSVELDALLEPDSADVRGVLIHGVAGRWTRVEGRAWPVQAGSNDPTQFAGQYPYTLLRLVLRRTEQPRGAPAALRPVPLPPMTDGPHLSYAIQWFAFAAIALVGSVALYRHQQY